MTPRPIPIDEISLSSLAEVTQNRFYNILLVKKKVQKELRVSDLEHEPLNLIRECTEGSSTNSSK